MAYNVRVEFLGLTGVVPNSNPPLTKPHSYIVALPDLEFGLRHPSLPWYFDDSAFEGDEGEIEKLQLIAPPHVAAVIVPAESVVAESRKHAALKFRSYDGTFAGGDYLLYVFQGENLALTPLEESDLDAPYTRIGVNGQGPVPQAPGEENGLQWIPQLSLANARGDREVGKFARDKFLYSDLTPRPADSVQLAGTVLIEHGRFFVDNVIQQDGGPAEFELKVPIESDPEWRQARYSRMLWDSEVEGDRLDLVFTSGSWDGPGIVSLRALHGRWDVWIANLELEVLLGVGRETQRNTRADLDFSILYLFGTNVPSQEQGTPVPHDPSGGVGGGSPRCGSSLFDE